ncbi:Snoal-like polyketide cyclase family protein [Colletotrichum higginsianum IMI 349063]|uniref:Snoal-like polyketide cyclase family protein n=2 Tax=Colletotrichum higginsianum TaxID=80884 RepID=A0A1B7Y4R0_COLHI|nr:Snoal-like polyketide cyclase family protein [Colletotrichum higginsianum IMI 349063]OBR07021.1 Snoal-like polyketide cyclase family protein [Colletotrichum higginsianum IMI 349063]TIC92722.1 hypothetical protein CH35J_010032 [Colletotrichum higginsianum]
MRAFSFLALSINALAWATNAADPPSCEGTTSASSAPYCPPRPATPEEQRAILGEFMEAFYEERNATKALLNHVAEDYIQHNPNALSGRQNTLNVLAPFVSPSSVNNTIMHTALENNTAYIHYRMDLAGGGEPFAVVDVFRFDGTCIMEHWDVAQQRPVNATNPIAMF